MANILKSTFKPKLIIDGCSVESMKWLALILMTIDHINRYLFDSKLPVMCELGRLAMPLFCFVLAYNLARPKAYESGMHLRAMQRLLRYGLLTTPIYFLLDRYYPLNMMFSLLLSTYLIYLIEKRGSKSSWSYLAIFLIGGFFVEYLWFATAYSLAAWWYCKQPSYLSGLTWLAATALLYVINQNHWSLAALPIIYLACHIKINIPHLRQVFYIYYPLHLAVLLMIKTYLNHI